jgi:pimeloyl-ACP methyl ester carboxylesterase
VTVTTPTTLTTADGVRLAACWTGEPAGAERAVVLVHGFAGSKDDGAIVDLAACLTAAGYAVLTYDSRGHGASAGLCTLGELERLDVDAAVAAAAERAADVVVVGASMGGIAVLNHLAALDPSLDDPPELDPQEAGEPVTAPAEMLGARVRGAVVVATPARWRVPRTWRGMLAVVATQTGAGRAVAARRFQARLAVRPIRGAPPVDRIRLVRRPIAVVHGLDDRFLPPDAATTLFGAGNEPRRLDLVPGMGHGYGAEAVGPIEAAVGWVMETSVAGTV